MPGQSTRLIIFVTAIAAVLASIACTTDKERIDAQNAAARTAAAGGGEGTPAAPRTGGVSVFDLRVGDCLPEDAIFGGEDGELDEETRTELVDCASEEAYGRVSRLHLIDQPDGVDYPGDDAMYALAEGQCATPGEPYTYYTPLKESWDQGDRTITCIESTVFAYDVGSCVAGEADGYRVVPCESDLVFAEVVRIVDLAPLFGPEAALPPDTLWDSVFDEQCVADADFFLFPTPDTWAIGDRLVICVLTV